jgi:hypothetical protein
MNTSTMFVLLTLGAANLSIATTLPAFADSNTPTTNGTGNCSTARDNANNKRCLTKPREGQKTGADQYADDREKLHSGRGSAPAPREIKAVATTVGPTGTTTHYSDGGTSFQPFGSSDRTITRGGSTYTITTRPGPGGSGGGRTSTSTR